LISESDVKFRSEQEYDEEDDIEEGKNKDSATTPSEV